MTTQWLGVIVAHIFISYATPDRAIADEVSGWLRSAGRRGDRCGDVVVSDVELVHG